MKNFHIEYPDEGLREALIDKINNLTKPKGSLGVLEDLALQIGLIQQTLSPTLSHPHNVLFAADHGIVEEGVSKSPKEITWQQLSNFLHGGAGVNFLCRQHGFKLVLVDSGVDYDLPYEKGIINCSVGRGTHSFLKGPAMSMEEMELCLERGAKITDMIHADGCNVVSFGEMGIGNTSPSSIWMHSSMHFSNIFSPYPLSCCSFLRMAKRGIPAVLAMASSGLRSPRMLAMICRIRYWRTIKNKMCIGGSFRRMRSL